MKELTDEQKPSPVIWWWFAITIFAVIWMVVLTGRTVVPTRWAWQRTIVVLTLTMVWGFSSRILTGSNGVRRMFADYWRLGIRGHDRVWFLVPDSSMTDGYRMDDRIEPSWQRNALLSGNAPGRYPFCIYQRLLGWRRAFRIGWFNGTPHIAWRNDLKLTPNYGQADYLVSLDVRDKHGLCLRFSLEEMLCFLNVAIVPTLYRGISSLLRQHGTQSIMLRKSAEATKALEDDNKKMRQDYNVLLSANQHDQADWQYQMKASEHARQDMQQQLRVSKEYKVYAANLGTVLDTVIMAFNEIIQRMECGTRLRCSKEGKTVIDALLRARSDIKVTRLQMDKARHLAEQNVAEQKKYEPPTVRSVQEMCFPKKA